MKRLLYFFIALPLLAQAQGMPGGAGKTLKGLKVSGEPMNVSSVAPEVSSNGANSKKEMMPYVQTITAKELEAHLAFLASDEVEGRETGERGQKLAAKYLATQFQEMGLAPGNGDSYFQEYELTRTQINSVSVSFDGKKQLAFGKDFTFFDKGSFAESVRMPLAFGGFGIQTDEYDNLGGLDLAGKAVLVLSGEPEIDGTTIIAGSSKEDPLFDYGSKRSLLEKAGAKAMVLAVPDDRFKRLANNPWMKHMMESPSLRLTHLDEGGIPVIFVAEETANMLLKKSKGDCGTWRKQLAQDGKVSEVAFGKYDFSINSDALKEVIVAENVLGFIEGTDRKEEVVVITAHYDHLGVKDGVVYNGADDDGSGTVALLEIAEAFMAAVADGKGPRRSVLIMPVSGEEKGLLGSRYYTDFPVYPLSNTKCNLNVDMIGRIDDRHEDGNYVYIIGSNMIAQELHDANETANKKVTELELDYTYNTTEDPNRYYYRSDHYNFAKNGIPCIFYFSGVHEDYHKSTDTIEKIDFDKTERIAQLIFATAWEVCNGKW